MARNAAFEILYADYYVRVFGLCRRLLGSAERAEDATQETFMRAYRSFNRYDTKQPFWQWIATIANYHCVDLLRKDSKASVLFGSEAEEVEQLESGDASVLSDLISSEDAAAINDAVARLAPKYRVPLVLAYFNQFSYDQIADQLKISRNHVGVLLLRAKERLRADLAGRGGEGETT